jgi:glycosyltransferase involved in cell wall biosynthesis
MLSDYTLERHAWMKKLYWQLLERRNVCSAAGIHVTSEQECEEARRMCPNVSTFVIPNGVDEGAFTWPIDRLRLRTLCNVAGTERPMVLYLSRLHPKKGIIDRLLPAIASLRFPCFLAIAGSEDVLARGYRNEIVVAIERHSIQDRVAFLGSVIGDDRWPLFDGADVFVLPSHSENFGIVVAEAMARGCPVVVTDAVQSSPHVAAAGAGEVIAGDVGSLARALERVLGDRDLQRAYGEAGRRYAAQNFRWDRIAGKVGQMYRDCLDGRKIIASRSAASQN